MAKKINQTSGMPQMRAAFSNWTISLMLKKITQSVDGGFVNDIETTIHARGTWQPLSAEEIALKPDGQRSWSWFDLHIKGQEILFETDDRVIYLNTTYKVMAVKDYTLNNYSEYHLIRDYQEST